MDTGLTISKDEQISYTKWVVEKVREPRNWVRSLDLLNTVGSAHKSCLPK